MKSKIAARIYIALTTVGLGISGFSGCDRPPAKTGPPAKPNVAFKPQEMANALHSIIAADHETHFQQMMRSFQAGDMQRQDELLGSHAQMLRAAAESIQQKGAEFHYVLRSLWPINPRNLPETATERQCLEYVSNHSGKNFYTEESLGGRRYFTAVYAMTATSDSCTDCHNRNPASPKTDFKPGDIMGGLIVRVPLEF